MIFLNHIQEVTKYLNVPHRAVDFMQRIGTDTPNGRYDFGESCYVNVMDSNLIPREGRRAEAHDVYIDVQYLITGEERIYYTDRRELPLETPYLPEKDVSFYLYEEAPFVDFSAGQAVILDTEEAHHPGCALGGPVTVKKVVMKAKKSDCLKCS